MERIDRPVTLYREAAMAIRRGMLLFRQVNFASFSVEFDKAIELDPRQKAYLWQRGLSLYYLDSGVSVFFKVRRGRAVRLDVAQNPNDTRSPYGASCAKHNYMEQMKQGDDFLRQVVVLTSILNL
ncbi:hypothetical protein CK203_021166 [Vitis vinifera]|uniref:Uncharacterized protein n=1 Tax=Vitis vinifera TaxID=29760 RepID=A0A438IMF7_VITVI|nr:hypothetical protein CK203_021166 [Vitis vinifera]